jgi:glutathione synthase/RimK-type ligase-like ATP-grasp enzyme
LILLWGNRRDSPLAAVAESLARRRTPFVLVDELAAVARPWTPSSEAILRADGRDVPLAEVTSAYLRPETDARGLADPRGLAATLLAWADRTSTALVVNRPAAMAPNMSKPLQLRLLVELGLRVPETLVTTDPDAVRDFVARHREVVYKSVSGTRSVVRRLDASRLGELDDVVHCPTLFQRYIAGEEWRVHVIGLDVHAISIRTDADDYRYAPLHGVPVHAAEVTPSAELAQELVRVTAAMHLVFSGIDMRHSPSGESFCLEVNPSPAFTYYEQLAGVDIAASVASLLEGGLHRLRVPA